MTIARKLSHGQEKQLFFEAEAAERLTGVEWTTVALHCAPTSNSFTRRIPYIFRPLFLRHLYGWIVATKLSRKNDILLMRHMTFDPFSFVFSPFLRNRASVHHSKEVSELRLIRRGFKGQLASTLETWAGRFSLKRAVAVVGVTEEIAQYEVQRLGTPKPIGVYPNAINASLVQPLDDSRDVESINIAFICGTFTAWHGLERLFSAILKYSDPAICNNLRIHLIGTLNPGQLETIRNESRLTSIFQPLGHMSEDKYRPVLDRCDIGLTSFALDLQDLKEAATLKVREMLAMGLPIYSGHKDTCLDSDFPYFLHEASINIDNMLHFASEMKKTTRLQVRESAKTHIEKISVMATLADFFVANRGKHTRAPLCSTQ